MELRKEKYYTEQEYEKIDSNGLVEYDNGRIIMMAPPLRIHQTLITTLSYLIHGYLIGKHCKVYVSPFNVRLVFEKGDIKRVEPDISVVCDENKLTDKGCEGAPDFIIEVVSPNNKMHDYVTKVQWYQQAGVKEYWIVDPHIKAVLVYRFDTDEVFQYTFNDIVSVGIWNGNFSVDLSQINLA